MQFSDGMITGAQGGHPDAAQGAKCTIVICPLLQGRIPAICTDVTTVTTPGESIDVVVTDYGVAVDKVISTRRLIRQSFRCVVDCSTF